MMTKPALGADLKRLPRDPQGRAKIDESVLSKAIAANDGGLSWPVIAYTLGCNERNLRERAGKWRKRQEAEKASKSELEEAAMTKERERQKRLALQEMRSQKQWRDWGPAADPTDTRLWNVIGPQGRPLASRQPSELSCRLMTVLSAAGVECRRVLSLDKPTPAPVINPTKAGGFTVQITVNPIESSG